MKTIARKTLSKLKAHTLQFQKKHAPITIFALRRGGSTMLADAIAASPGVWFANEPYAVLPAHPAYDLKRQELPAAEHSHFFNLAGQELDQFQQFTDNLLEARYRALGTCRNTFMPLTADRVCLKILNAPWMIDWYSANTDAHIVSLIRHPAAQALSVLRQGWQFPLEAYAKRTDELTPFFSSQQIDLIRNVASSNDSWQIAVMDWIVTSYPLRMLGGDNTIRIRYEDLVRDPGHFTEDMLHQKFGLEDSEAMLSSFSRPSNSSSMSQGDVNNAIHDGNLKKLTDGWRNHLTAEQNIAGQKLLDSMNVSEYRFDV